MKLLTKSPSKITNYSGKKRRTASKRIVLGLIYGRGPASIAEQIGSTLDEAKDILENVYSGFPQLAKWISDTKETTTKNGISTDMFGRIRHLPDAMLPRYSFESISSKNSSKINPFLLCEDTYVDTKLIDKYQKLLEDVKYKSAFNKVSEQALSEGIRIVDNQSKIAQSIRESQNWQCQAATASWIKLNMIAIANDEIMKELGAELILTIHDEVQVSVDKENAEACKERLEYLMSNTVSNVVCVPLPSDGNIEWSGRWYMSEMETQLNEHFNKYKASGMSDEDAYNKICEEESELLPENIHSFLFDGDYLK